MAYQTLSVTDIPHGKTIMLNRIAYRNSLNTVAINELNNVLDESEKNTTCKILILKGQQNIFCTGMDFKEMTQAMPFKEDETKQFASHYAALLKRFTAIPKIIIAIIEGEVLAGGLGLVAASDIVIASPRSQFTLSEALWGLLPANVMPYLIRRIGFQKAYWMTLSTKTISAAEAHAIHLIDELNEDPEAILHTYLLRLTRLHEQTIRDIKNYFRKMWIIDENMEQTAISELARLMNESRIQDNIKRFIEQGKFPWEEAHG